MKSYKITIFFKWCPFPKTYTIVSHAILKDIDALDLSLADGRVVLYPRLARVRKLKFGPEYSAIMKERYLAEQQRLNPVMQQGTAAPAPVIGGPANPEEANIGG